MNKRVFSQTVAFCLATLVLTGCGRQDQEQQSSSDTRLVLATTFPIYQITRNVVKDRAGASVKLMLPSQLGCPHDYALTPQDMQKLTQADTLVINGLGLEEFLGAAIFKENKELKVIDSSKGIVDTLQYAAGESSSSCETDKNQGTNCANTEKAGETSSYEWAGAFKLEKGRYRWTFAKVNGKYADPAMKMLMISSHGDAPIESVKVQAGKMLSAQSTKVKTGEAIPLGSSVQLCFYADKEISGFDINVDKAGIYVFFCEHIPYEFEANEHFLKKTDGTDVEPIMEEPEGGHHHHHHTGDNPHLFASPRIVAKLANTIATQLSELDPAGKRIYTENALLYAKKMNKLADKMVVLGKKLKNNRIVTSHGIFDYLARDMGLKIVAVMQPHGQEPSASEMLSLVKIIGETKAGGIFSEPQYPEKTGQVLAQETGIAVGVLDPVATGPENAPLDYYESVMQQNMITLEQTLGTK